MKMDPQSAVQNHASARVHEPSTKAKAHGLVRQLEEDTFNGASADKLRARFMHRLTESSTDAAGGSTAPLAPSENDTIGGSATAESTPPSIGDDGSLLGDSSAITDGAAVTGTIEAPWYGDGNASYLFGGTGQQFDWSV